MKRPNIGNRLQIFGFIINIWGVKATALARDSQEVKTVVRGPMHGKADPVIFALSAEESLIECQLHSDAINIKWAAAHGLLDTSYSNEHNKYMNMQDFQHEYPIFIFQQR